MNTILKTFIAGAALTFAGSAAANVLYSQPYDGSGILYASQNDTAPGGFGNFATVYDDFTLASAANLNGFDFTGGYFNPGPPGTITAFTLTFYNDAGGVPGNPIATGSFPGDGNETPPGGAVNTYSLAFQNFQVAAGTYWASIVPDIAFPPQWGWASSGTGNGLAYQCFFGACGPINGGGVNVAFDVLGNNVGIPEPAAWALMLVGFGGLGVALRARRRTATAAV